MVGVVAAVSFLVLGSVQAQGTCNPACDSHAYCYSDYSSSRGTTYFCACNGYYVGNGYSCKYSTWRVVLYILSSVIGFILIFFLCLSCLGYFRRKQEQPVSYPMQPMGNPPYGYPPPPAPAQSTANPAMYSYPPQTGYPAQTGYPPQTGYPANSYPPQVANPPSTKVPGPSGTV